METTRVIVVSTSSGRLNWCPKCEAEMEMLTAEEAAIVARTNCAEILQRIRDQLLHSIQTPGYPVLICPKSLLE